jgi:membrane-bound inhibitor of C-type lysozyme
MARSRRLTMLALTLGWLVCTAAALARPANYKCGDELEFKVDFTPSKAQLHLPEKDLTLARVKSAHDAHYVNSKAGVGLVAMKGELALTQGTKTLQCKLQIQP